MCIRIGRAKYTTVESYSTDSCVATLDNNIMNAYPGNVGECLNLPKGKNKSDAMLPIEKVFLSKIISTGRPDFPLLTAR